VSSSDVGPFNFTIGNVLNFSGKDSVTVSYKNSTTSKGAVFSEEFIVRREDFLVVYTVIQFCFTAQDNIGGCINKQSMEFSSFVSRDEAVEIYSDYSNFVLVSGFRFGLGFCSMFVFTPDVGGWLVPGVVSYVCWGGEG